MIQRYVDAYIEDYNTGRIELNQERIELFEYLEREIVPRLESGEIYFNEKQIDDCVGYIERWFFPLEPFQKFLIPFIFLYFKKNNLIVYRKFLYMMARGAGKNGLISGVASFLLTPMHGVKNYNISIIANSEDQAKTSFHEIYTVIEENAKLERLFYKTKSEILSRQTKSIIKFRTSNGNTKDGLRDGAVIFDEIHQYESNRDVRVHLSGLGKVINPREFYIGTDGYVREGFIDKQKEKAKAVLKGRARWNSTFPFICKLDSVEQVDDKTKWQLANPMFHEPMSDYAANLFETVLEQYEDLQDDPSNREEFLTKRMNLPVTDTERSVATYEELVATKEWKEPYEGQRCIGGFDFASTRDFAAVGLLFKSDEKYVWKTHSFVRKGFVDAIYGYSKPKDTINGKRQFAPIRLWEEKGWLTVVDTPTIDPHVIVHWFVEQRDLYAFDIDTIIGDYFRMDLLRPIFLEAGFEQVVSERDRERVPSGYRLEVVRNPRAIDSLLAPRIENAFAGHKILFGENDMMRWYTNNVLRKLKSDGNVEYLKKEDVRRKTDGFKAFECAMYRADELNEPSYDFEDFYDDVMDWYEVE